MSDEQFELLLTKIAAQKIATAQVLGVLVLRLVRDGSLEAGMLVEHLHILQSNLPGFSRDAPAAHAAIGREVLETLGTYIQAIDQSIGSLDDEY
ncbi:hypothetical protein V5F44_20340 [Xanthobacter sp. V2C-8]|uniref:hypothetical protein n=1 Tax=Xanthobacter albus TaxID=3119929 RepID=UPI003727F3A6